MKNKNIVQSSIEPNKEDLWFNKGDIKYFGNKGWKSITDTAESESLEGKVAALETSVKANTTALTKKVDKEGYIAYTQEEKTKLAGLSSQKQADWNATTGVTAIQNKPTNLVTTTALTTALSKKVDAVEGKGLSTNDYTAAEKTKLAGIATGATKNTTMTAATASAAGTGGLVPAPGAGKQASFLRGDGTWAVPTDTKYTLPAASATAIGGVKAGAAIADVAADAELAAVVTAFNTLLANLRTAGIILKA